MSFMNKLNFHNVKKAVVSTTSPSEHPTEQADPAFEAALSEFTAYHQHISSLDSALSSYAKHYFALFTSSNEIIVGMSSAISNNDATALRNTFANTRTAHAVLTGEREADIANQLRGDCIKPIAEEMATHNKILASIQQRHELARELDYYTTKMDSLLQEKAAKESKGKAIDSEKIERNQKKKDEAVSVYAVVNSEVVTQMHNAIARKGELLMQVFDAFENVERRVADLYLSAVAGGEGLSKQRGRSSFEPAAASPPPSEVTISLGMEGAGSEPHILSIQTPPPSYSAIGQTAGKKTSPQPRSPQPPKDPPPPPKLV